MSAASRMVPIGASQEWVYYREKIEGQQDMLVFSVNLPAEVSEEAVRRAVRQVIATHDALRTRIVPAGDGKSLIVEPLDRAVDMLDWRTRHVPDPGQEGLDQWHDDILGQPFDVAEGAARCVLAVTPVQRRLVFLVHHSMCDGLAINVVVRDFLNALCGFPLPPRRRQASDHGFERDPAVEERNLNLWLATLAGAPANATYTARKVVARPEDGDLVAIFRLNRQLTSRLQHVARTARSTFFALWLSLVHAWGSQYTGEHDMVLAMMTANRSRRDDHDIVANISRPLWLRVAGQPGDTFAQRLTAVQAALCERLPWTAYNPVHVFEALCSDARRRGASFRPAVNTSLHILGGAHVPHGRSEEHHVVCESSLAGPVRVVHTGELPESSWSDLRVESVVKGGELKFWIFLGQAIWHKRAPAELVADLVSVLTTVSQDGLGPPVEAPGVPFIGARDSVKDRRSGSRLDLELVASALRSIPGVTSAGVQAGANGSDRARIITADVSVEPASLTEQTPALLQREFLDRVPGYRGVAVPEVWRIRSGPLATGPVSLRPDAADSPPRPSDGQARR
jgi:hypothetical protein